MRGNPASDPSNCLIPLMQGFCFLEDPYISVVSFESYAVGYCVIAMCLLCQCRCFLWYAWRDTFSLWSWYWRWCRWAVILMDDGCCILWCACGGEWYGLSFVSCNDGVWYSEIVWSMGVKLRPGLMGVIADNLFFFVVAWLGFGPLSAFLCRRLCREEWWGVWWIGKMRRWRKWEVCVNHEWWCVRRSDEFWWGCFVCG